MSRLFDAGELVPFLCGVIFSAGGLVMLLRLTRRDVNGLGRNVRAGIACQLRCAAEEDPISRAKIMHIAELIAPR